MCVRLSSGKMILFIPRKKSRIIESISYKYPQNTESVQIAPMHYTKPVWDDLAKFILIAARFTTFISTEITEKFTHFTFLDDMHLCAAKYSYEHKDVNLFIVIGTFFVNDWIKLINAVNMVHKENPVDEPVHIFLNDKMRLLCKYQDMADFSMRVISPVFIDNFTWLSNHTDVFTCVLNQRWFPKNNDRYNQVNLMLEKSTGQLKIWSEFQDSTGFLKYVDGDVISDNGKGQSITILYNNFLECVKLLSNKSTELKISSKLNACQFNTCCDRKSFSISFVGLIK